MRHRPHAESTPGAPNLRDPSQFDAAVRDLRPAVLRWARIVLRDDAAAEDLAQDLFTQLWLNPEAYDSSRTSLRSYLRVLTRSRAIDRFRTRGAHQSAAQRLAVEQLSHPRAAESPEAPALRREVARQLLHALDELPREQRAAVLLAAVGELTASELALASEIPLGTAKSRIRIGLSKMRGVLDEAA
ncbi:MAG TPA: sigma-70 family RNA polymerase sigma factor [Thermoleophilaceae bacterium]